MRAQRPEPPVTAWAAEELLLDVLELTADGDGLSVAESDGVAAGLAIALLVLLAVLVVLVEVAAPLLVVAAVPV